VSPYRFVVTIDVDEVMDRLIGGRTGPTRISPQRCAICGSGDSTMHHVKDNFEIRRCSSCSIVHLNQPSNSDWAGEFYSMEYFEGAGEKGYASYQHCENFLTLNFRRRVRQLSRYVPEGNVLDVGCGYGFFLKCLGEQYKGCGIDVSEHAVRVAREMYGLDVKSGVLNYETFEPNYFSLITLWDTIEHLPDPRYTFEILHRMLKEDGVVALTTGNVESLVARICGKRWHLYSFPEHLWFFSPRTLRDLLEKTGFRIVEFRNEWCYYSIHYLIERVLKTLLRAPSVVERIPFEAFLRRAVVPVSLLDVMYVICRKKEPGRVTFF